MDKKQLSILTAEINYQILEIDKIISKIDERKRDFTHESRSLESLAYQFHNLYCAFEDLFKMVAKFFENVIEDERRYHIELLKRMMINIEGVRPPLISKELASSLDDFRAFRHFFRHAYSYEIDNKKIGLLIERFEIIKKRYKEDISNFFKLLKID
ncbi:MAG: hypothetical protein SCARUB_04343 [Candidatus Scalindua rubra]|uniref:HepT-like domain-containing protein n=1 Tax=Candidatus Scalindua rubra TaxID=1872076 RepID=A0A1E3X4G3_9BACT|nr:MAG: hypothetical protein SCARUB_04343 [Candidatus Scalindua rubra]